jgi:hypothetical protein
MAFNLGDFSRTLQDDRHRRVFEYWRSEAPKGRLPGRRDIDPLEGLDFSQKTAVFTLPNGRIGTRLAP